MFTMFVIGMLVGAASLAVLLCIVEDRPSAFKVAVISLLLTIVAGQWKIASQEASFQKQYDHLTGGKGDGFK